MTTDKLVEAFVAKLSSCGLPIQLADNTAQLAQFDESLPKRLPPSFASLLSRYSFPAFDVLGLSFFGWKPDSNAFVEQLSMPKGSLAELLLPNNYVQIARPDSGDFDAVCFDLNQKRQNREYPIVRIDHEEILCNWRVRVTAELWPSFIRLMEIAASASDLKLYWERSIE